MHTAELEPHRLSNSQLSAEKGATSSSSSPRVHLPVWVIGSEPFGEFRMGWTIVAEGRRKEEGRYYSVVLGSFQLAPVLSFVPLLIILPATNDRASAHDLTSEASWSGC